MTDFWRFCSIVVGVLLLLAYLGFVLYIGALAGLAQSFRLTDFLALCLAAASIGGPVGILGLYMTIWNTRGTRRARALCLWAMPAIYLLGGLLFSGVGGLGSMANVLGMFFAVFLLQAVAAATMILLLPLGGEEAPEFDPALVFGRAGPVR